jgi:hypothetical protein
MSLLSTKSVASAAVRVTGGQIPEGPSSAPQRASVVTCAVIAALLCACGYAGDDEIQAETTAILERVPVGTPFMEVPAAMGALGFSCSTERREVADAQGSVRGTESHFSCIREQSHWLVCTRRTRAVFTHLNGKVANVLVNVGRLCF